MDSARQLEILSQFSRIKNQDSKKAATRRNSAGSSVPDWRRFYNAAITTADPNCLDIVIDEATKALDRRLEELGKLPKNAENLKESEQIILAAKRLLVLRSHVEEDEDDTLSETFATNCES